jgi:integrase
LGPAGLPIAGDKPFHRFRRTSATQVKKGAGRASATEQLGHSDPRVTDLYLDAEELGASRGCDQTPDIDVPALERQLRLFE